MPSESLPVCPGFNALMGYLNENDRWRCVFEQNNGIVFALFEPVNLLRTYVLISSQIASGLSSALFEYPALSKTLKRPVICSFPDSKVYVWGQHGAHLGPVGPRWAPCWSHEPCYLGCFFIANLNNLSNKQLGCWRFQPPWLACNTTIMWCSLLKRVNMEHACRIGDIITLLDNCNIPHIQWSRMFHCWLQNTGLWK